MKSSKAVDEVRPVLKRLFVFCDGTWKDGVNKTGYLTNVATLARCLEGVADDGYLQIAYYDNGIGNTTSVSAHLIDGVTGRGISPKIKNAYSFLSHNYSFEHKGDEIFLVGFSRGAFTVQCLASFISQTGLLHKPNLYFLRGLFTLWANQHLTSSKTRLPQNSLVHRVSEFQALGALSTVKIKACLVWDTVSNLGPLTPWIRPYPFVGDKIPSAVENAFQVLALSEARSQFKPSIWTTKDSTKTVVKQCWFSGTHADVGGYGDAALGAITLVWMIEQVRAISGVKFNEAEIGKHLKLRCFEWEIVKNGLFGGLKQRLTLSHRPSSGYPTKSSPLWWLLGRGHRKLSAAVLHRNAEYDIDVSVHFTVRLAMVRDPRVCRLLRRWQTTSADGSVHWERDTDSKIEDSIKEDVIGPGNEFEILKSWSEETFELWESERTAFTKANGGIPMHYEEEARGAVNFVASILRGVESKDDCIVPSRMYKPKGGISA